MKTWERERGGGGNPIVIPKSKSKIGSGQMDVKRAEFGTESEDARLSWSSL